MHVIWMCMRFWTTFLDPHVPKTRFFTIDFNDFWTPSRAHFVPHRGQQINSLFRPSTLRSASDFIKRLKNVKLSSKSGFSPQELPNWSQNTNMKWLKNVKLSSKSCFSPQELRNLSRDTHMKRINPQQLPNLTQNTNMKRLNYVKLSSQSGFRPHELPKLSQDTLVNPLKRWVLSRCAALERSQYYMLYFHCSVVIESASSRHRGCSSTVRSLDWCLDQG